MGSGFAHLHVHSDMSQLDGCARVSDYVNAAAERGDEAIALTDHGTLRGLITLTEACDAAGIKPVYGVELYLCDDMKRRGLTEEEKAAVTAGVENKTRARELIKEEEARVGVRRLYHLTAWALDNDGLRNLYRLTSLGWTQGFYYKPRVDLEALAEHAQGLAVGTGCIGSVVNLHVTAGRPRAADVAFGTLHDIFGDRLFLEVMPHDLPAQIAANRFALTVRALDKHRLVATQDAHYIRRQDAKHHDVLLAIESHAKLEDPERFRFNGSSYWMKTREEMVESFARSHTYIQRHLVGEAIATTQAIAQACRARIEIDPLKCLVPPVEIPSGFESEYQYLVHLVAQGLSARDVPRRAERLADREGIEFDAAMRIYTDRVKRELRVLREAGFAPYFLVIHDMYRWAKEQGIARGPGRGSAAGSLVSYLIGITDVDPIEHRLMFERFIAPGRINWPDIDCDFQDDRRAEILGYLRQRYGEDRVAQISTIGRMNGRQVLKDVSRVYEVSFQRANVAASAVPPDPNAGAIAEARERSEFFRGFCKEYPEVVDHAIALEGLAKSMGVHAAGVVASPVPLTDVVPLETRRSGGSEPQVVTAFDMRGVEGVGLLKIDVLGLKGITILENARRAVSEKVGKELVLDEIRLDDPATLRGFTLRDFVGVFQFDTASSHSVCDGMEFRAFDDVAAVNAINRPGAIAFADEFKRRRANPSLARKHLFHPRVTEITADSLGLMIYQEHVVRIAVDVAGMTPAAADKLRKKIGKSEGYEALEKDRHGFVEGCRKKTPDLGRDDAERLFDSVVKFGRYGFNRSHAVCYSLIAYWMMWLKQHCPLEFYWALMSAEGDAKKIQRYARDARDRGVETLLPDVNVSGSGFAIDYARRAVRGSLVDISGVGEAAVDEIVGKRAEEPFRDVADFIARCRGKKVTKRTFDALARGGALDSMTPNPRWLIGNVEALWRMAEKKQYDQIRMAVEGSARKWQWEEAQRLRVAADVNPLANPPHPLIEWEGWLSQNVKVPLQEISEELLAEPRNVYVAGVVVEVAERYVGDTKSLEEFPDEETQRAIGWGKPWVRLTVEGVEGGRSWIKLDWTIVEEFRSVIDRGVGALVLACARTRPDWQNLDAHYIADLEAMAEKLKEDPGRLTVWERLFVEEHHPAKTYPWDTKSDRRLAQRNVEEVAERSNGSFTVIGVISHLFTRPDKRGKEMAFFGIAGLRSYLNALCFSSSWEELSRHVRPGVFARLKLTRLDGGTACLDAGKSGALHLLGKG